jgi:hypothetical protein
MTPRSEQSEWVEREIIEAEGNHKLILPLQLEGEIWFRLSNYQAESVVGAKMPTDRFVKGGVARAPLEVASRSGQADDTKHGVSPAFLLYNARNRGAQAPHFRFVSNDGTYLSDEEPATLATR